MNIVYDRGKFYNEYVKYRETERPFSETAIAPHGQITRQISARVFERIGETSVRRFITLELPNQ